MAQDFIRVNPNVTPDAQFYGSRLVSLTQQLRAAIDLVDQLKTLMDHMNTGVDFTEIEATFGLPAGSGQIVYDLMNGSLMAIRGEAQNTNVMDLINRVG